jgi:hypothetical protein
MSFSEYMIEKYGAKAPQSMFPCTEADLASQQIHDNWVERLAKKRAAEREQVVMHYIKAHDLTVAEFLNQYCAREVVVGGKTYFSIHRKSSA